MIFLQPNRESPAEASGSVDLQQPARRINSYPDRPWEFTKPLMELLPGDILWNSKDSELWLLDQVERTDSHDERYVVIRSGLFCRFLYEAESTYAEDFVVLKDLEALRRKRGEAAAEEYARLNRESGGLSVDDPELESSSEPSDETAYQPPKLQYRRFSELEVGDVVKTRDGWIRAEEILAPGSSGGPVYSWAVRGSDGRVSVVLRMGYPNPVALVREG